MPSLQSDLQQSVAILRRTLGARDLEWTRRADGSGSHCNIGAIYLEKGSITYGNAWAVMQTIDNSGAAYALIRANTARELLSKVRAFIDGYRLAMSKDYTI